MPDLPTCQCNAGLPIQQQLANIYCALYTLNTGGSGPDGGFLTINGVQTTTNKTLVAPVLTETTTAGRIVATSTTEEHQLVANFTAVGFTTANVLSVRHTDPVGGCAAIRFFVPGTMNEMGAVGIGGTFLSNLYHCTYLEGSDEQNQGSGLDIRIIQRSTLGGTKAYASSKRFQVSSASGGKMTFWDSTGLVQIVEISDGFLKAGTTTGTCQIQASCDFAFTSGGFRNLNSAGSPDSMFAQATDNNVYILTSGGAGGNRLNILAAGGASQFLFDCATGQLLANGGNKVGTNGTGISLLRHGTATLTAGTVTVNDANVTANSRIFINRFTDGGTIGDSYSITRSAGVSFTITSKTASATQTLDTSVVAWEMLNP